MSTPRNNPRSRGERDPHGQRGERGRSTPRGERGGNSGGSGNSGRPQRSNDRNRDQHQGGRGERGSRSGDRTTSQGNQNRRDDRGGPRRDDRAPSSRSGGPSGNQGRRDRNDGGRSGSRSGERSSAARGPASRDPAARDNSVPRGGGQAENKLSSQARKRLGELRAEYDPRDEDRPSSDPRDAYTGVPGGIRLQKALAQAGVASRRASEELIAEGRVSVDGHVVRRFGARVDPETSEIRVDDMRVATAPDLLYYAMNKPRGVISTMSDPGGRPALADYTGHTEERLFHVGRLDTETEGLILLTNDGELANRLTHPSYKIAKTYIAKVPGFVPRDVVRQVRAGVELEDGPVEVDAFRVVDNMEPKALVEVQLHEGRKHIVRRLMEAVGHPVSDLARTKVGPIDLNNLKPGTMRALTAQEVSEIYTAVGM